MLHYLCLIYFFIQCSSSLPDLSLDFTSLLLNSLIILIALRPLLDFSQFQSLFLSESLSYFYLSTIPSVSQFLSLSNLSLPTSIFSTSFSLSISSNYLSFPMFYTDLQHTMPLRSYQKIRRNSGFAHKRHSCHLVCEA